ncbi:uncharacterized protein LOC126818087 [Patella vulgata]|uniref:uncharacterized protein LOC126818087 n=1 Tax=Patella vulgata TaxID=6465 RepID=UPI0024A96EA2|nr:uncharacterized protein LOC126818087 [Patella vulgata]
MEGKVPNTLHPKPSCKMVSILPKDIRKINLMERVPTQTISVQTIVDEVTHNDTPDITSLPSTPIKSTTVKKPDQIQKTIYEAFFKVVGYRKVTVQTISSDGKVVKSNVEEVEGDSQIINISKQEKINESISKFLVKKPDQYILKDDFLGKTNFSTTMTIKCPTFLQGGKERAVQPIETVAQNPPVNPNMKNNLSPVTVIKKQTPKSGGENLKVLQADIHFQMKRKIDFDKTPIKNENNSDDEHDNFETEAGHYEKTTDNENVTATEKVANESPKSSLRRSKRNTGELPKNDVAKSPSHSATENQEKVSKIVSDKSPSKMPTKKVAPVNKAEKTIPKEAKAMVKDLEKPNNASKSIPNKVIKRPTNNSDEQTTEIKDLEKPNVNRSIPNTGIKKPIKTSDEQTTEVKDLEKPKNINRSTPNKGIKRPINTSEEQPTKIKDMEKPSANRATPIKGIKRPTNTCEDQTIEIPIKRESKRQRKPTWKWKEMTAKQEITEDDDNSVKQQKETKTPLKTPTKTDRQTTTSPKVTNITDATQVDERIPVPLTPKVIIKQDPDGIIQAITSVSSDAPARNEETSTESLLAKAILSLSEGSDNKEASPVEPVPANIVKTETTKTLTDSINQNEDALEKESITITPLPPSDTMDSKKGILPDNNVDDNETDFSIFDDDEYEKRFGSKFKSIIRLHTCKFCPKKYQTRTGLLRHLQKHRKKTDVKDVCKVCKKEFDSKYLYEMHLTTHEHEIEDGRHKCQLCQKAYSTRSGLLKHHRTDKFCKLDCKFKCEYCHSSFSNEVSLEIHRRKHLLAPRERAHSCKKCEKTFETVGGLNKHLRNKACETTLTCEYCGKVFNNKNLYTKHLKVHTRIPAEGGVCEDCGKTFATSIALKSHRNSHLNIRNYTCQDCGKSFGQKGTLVSHRRIHTGERPYLCVTCGATFRYSCHLTQHTRSHTGEKPYGCHECERFFSCKQSLKKHVISHANRRKKSLNKLEHMNIEVKQEYIDITNVVNPTTEEIVFLNAITGEEEGTTTQYIYTTEDGEEIQGYLADSTDTVVTGDSHIQYHDSQNVVYQTIEGENVTIVDEMETSDLNILAETAENYESPSVTYVIVKK